MAKKSGSNFFLEKGEQIALGVGVAGLLGLLVFGVVSFSAADDPRELEKKLKETTKNVQTKTTTPGISAPDLAPWTKVRPAFPVVAANEYALTAGAFEPVTQPDMLRENPRVLGVYQWQVDVVRGPMRALDIQYDADGNILIGVVTTKKIADKDVGNFKKNLDGLREFLNPPKKGVRPVPRPAPPVGNPPVGNPPVGGPPVRSGGDPFGSGGVRPGGDLRRGEDKSVEYVTPEEAAKRGLPLAETVYPFKAVVVSTVFPIKAQLQEIQRALRLQKLEDAALEAAGGNVAGAPVGAPPVGGPPVGVPPAGGPKSPALTGSQAPVFDGFDVERRVVPPGTPADEMDKLPWAAYDHYGEYFTQVRARMLETQPDEGYLPYFVRYEQKMTAPLPQLIAGLGSYPSLRLPAVVDAIAKMREAQKPVLAPAALQLRFAKPNGQNPFLPPAAGQKELIGNFPGQPQPEPKKDPKVDPKANDLPDVDVMLLRFLDPDVEPGFSYQYRVRVKMRNPNFGKETLVREKSEAKKEVLDGPWVAIPALAVLPPDAHLYAYDPDEYLKTAKATVDEVKANVPNNKKDTAGTSMNNLLEYREVIDGRRAIVQFQTWMPQVLASGNKQEPVGTWVLSEVPVAVGEYIGKKSLVKLPLWSSSVANYVLRELGGGIKVYGVPADSQPKGWAVNFKTKSLLVDFEGGKSVTKFGGRVLTEPTAAELLILRPDGKLVLKNSARDMADEERVKRNADWDKWIADVKDRKEVVPGSTTPAPNPFK